MLNIIFRFIIGGLLLLIAFSSSNQYIIGFILFVFLGWLLLKIIRLGADIYWAIKGREKW